MFSVTRLGKSNGSGAMTENEPQPSSAGARSFEELPGPKAPGAEKETEQSPQGPGTYYSKFAPEPFQLAPPSRAADFEIWGVIPATVAIVVTVDLALADGLDWLTITVRLVVVLFAMGVLALIGRALRRRNASVVNVFAAGQKAIRHEEWDAAGAYRQWLMAAGEWGQVRKLDETLLSEVLLARRLRESRERTQGQAQAEP